MADGLSSSQQEESFEEWLSCRMRQLGLDEDVFGSYVTGVLDSEDTDEDRKDALIGILEGMTEYPLDDLCNEVIERWKTSRANVLQEKKLVKEQKAAEKQHKLAEIMEKQASTVCTTKSSQQKSDGEIKRLLVAQYGHESDEELCADSDEEQATRAPDKDPGLFKNVNAQSVTDKEKEKRDKMKEENDQRKQQIKEAKEKQKQKAEDRKEKEKKRTQKGERRAR
ncbi:coiled-coil domain-containing protein 43-like [Orbicella faveolata]|uniref:coiled-coil domain-containing protein 43-like n=1 Tax=Orbicella faveolata TaxID=48498 RepID=UPI0009E42DD4|nr:coiled-coil domain-containing protein 43-like [Orbicella faveolata]